MWMSLRAGVKDYFTPPTRAMIAIMFARPRSSKAAFVMGVCPLLFAAIGLVLLFSNWTSARDLGWVVGILVVFTAALGVCYIALGIFWRLRNQRPT